MLYLRTIESTGEVTNVSLGDAYTKVDFTNLSKNSPYAQEFLRKVDEAVEGGMDPGYYLCDKDNIMIVSESGQQYWLLSDNTHYIVGSDGKTLEKITPKMMQTEDWCTILSSFEN